MLLVICVLLIQHSLLTLVSRTCRSLLLSVRLSSIHLQLLLVLLLVFSLLLLPSERIRLLLLNGHGATILVR